MRTKSRYSSLNEVLRIQFSIQKLRKLFNITTESFENRRKQRHALSAVSQNATLESADATDSLSTEVVPLKSPKVMDVFLLMLIRELLY